MPVNSLTYQNQAPHAKQTSENHEDKKIRDIINSVIYGDASYKVEEVHARQNEEEERQEPQKIIIKRCRQEVGRS